MSASAGSTPRLQPCPFCGDEGRIHWSDDQEVVNVRCVNWAPGICLGAGANCYEEPEAIAAWNRRGMQSESAGSFAEAAHYLRSTTLAMGAIEVEDIGKVQDYFATRFEQMAAKGSRSAAASVEGWRLVKDSTFEQRSWKEDESHENGNYHNVCIDCGRTFQGHKRRPLCKVCTDHPSRSPSATSSASDAKGAARWRWLVATVKPQVMMDPFTDRYTLVISKGISVPINCKTGPGLYDHKPPEQTPTVDEAIEAAMNAADSSSKEKQ